MSTINEQSKDSDYGQVPAMPAPALIGGLAACVAGSVLWAVVTVVTKTQIGFMAVGMGLLVGFTVRYLGQGGKIAFGIMGALLSLVGCLLGNLLSQVGFYSIENGDSLVDIWTNLDFTIIPAIISESFQPIDGLFYVIALYVGFRFSINKPEALIIDSTELSHLPPSYPQNKKILAGAAFCFFFISLATALYLPNRTISVYYPSGDVIQRQGSIRWGEAQGLWEYWNPDGTRQAAITW